MRDGSNHQNYVFLAFKEMASAKFLWEVRISWCMVGMSGSSFQIRSLSQKITQGGVNLTKYRLLMLPEMYTTSMYAKEF